MPLNEWQQGFAWLKIDKDKNFFYDNKKIINGTVYN
jgi:hypothetical protein